MKVATDRNARYLFLKKNEQKRMQKEKSKMKWGKMKTHTQNVKKKKKNHQKKKQKKQTKKNKQISVLQFSALSDRGVSAYLSFWSTLVMMPSILGLTPIKEDKARDASSPTKPANDIRVLEVHTDHEAEGNTARKASPPAKPAITTPPESTTSAAKLCGQEGE